ncbi:MAG: group II intron reverse transcriptase/maturase [Lachnospiraceae bacterium]|nr:group II intron reverse transcriptase/maturase [Lachnospiraceae bacterium]
MSRGKAFKISQNEVLLAYKQVKANKGAGGVDGVEFVQYEAELKNNLYKLWNRMSSGCYYPKAVRGVEIPKKNGKKRLLGIPTIEDRVAQMVVKNRFEPGVEKIFHEDSYGYRPNKSAIDAIKSTRERCWKYEWVLELDIVGLFDNIDHEMLMKAVRKHTSEKWVVLYIERMLKSDIVMPDGKTKHRDAGTPQGGVISPVLANLFMHYAFDVWMQHFFPSLKWERYADDAVIHCYSLKQAEYVKMRLEQQLGLCKLSLHPDKTRIVHCTSDRFPDEGELNSFTFLGYTFRKRWVKARSGIFFNAFTPAVSNDAGAVFRAKIKEYRLFKGIGSLKALAEAINPVVRGWMNYFMAYGKREAIRNIDYVNISIVRFIMRFYKKQGETKKKAWKFAARIARQDPTLFYHWSQGIIIHA